MKRCIYLLVAILLVSGASAQTRSFDEFKKQQQSRFSKFKADKQAELEAFRKQQNERYAQFMEESWQRFRAHPAILPKQEKRVKPVIYQEPTPEPVPVVEPVDTTPAPAPVVEPEPVIEPVDTTPTPAPVVEPEPVVEPKPAPAPVPAPAPEPKVEEKPILVKKEVIKVPQPTPEPEPLAPVEPKEEIPYEKYHVTFYGTKVSVGFPTNETLKLPGLSEKQLAKAWKQLSSEAYDVTLNNVLAVRKKLALCDWGYVEMLQAISEKKYGKTNEAVFMQAYLLSQSGYKIRLATDDEKLYMLIATQQNMFSLPFFIIDNTKFYALNCKSQELSICKAKFDKEKVVSLQLRQEQKLAAQYTDPRKLTSKYGVVAQVSVNKNTIDFFNDYPSAYIGNDATTRWAVYANTPLEKVIRETLYPTLKKAVAGLSERDAVNKILNFVQTAFVYEYDDKIWGGDRAFFAAETLHYPYADCEDRSILFSRLVRDILGLDVVLIYYPGHLATAVAFTQDVHGDYLTHNNRKYIVCDPTYINAPLGRTMPGMNNQEARIIEL